MNTHLTRALAAAALASTALGSALLGVAVAHAEDTHTVLLSQLEDIDTMPVCTMEDGSDIDPAAMPCVWENQGSTWLTYVDRSYLVVDDTTVVLASGEEPINSTPPTVTVTVPAPAPAFPCIPAPFIVIPGLVPGVVQCGAQA